MSYIIEEEFMPIIGTFPFGQQVRNIIQTDRSPRRVFILGVYASAVHARWIGRDQKTIVGALAVASEPYIFWRGDGAKNIIQQISIPRELGSLLPAPPQFNGPSGIALDDFILNPLGITRADVWLCDLVPHSCMNPLQAKAIERSYLPVVQNQGLPIPTVPPVPKVLADEERRKSILSEIHEADASVLILLGDQPIQWFLSHYDQRWRNLNDFVNGNQPYGRLLTTRIDGRTIDILPLAHPRQIAKLGPSSPKWYKLHHAWMHEYANNALNS